MYSFVDNNGNTRVYYLGELYKIARSKKNLVFLSSYLNCTIDTTRNIIAHLEQNGYETNLGLEQYNKWTEEEDNQLENEYRSNMPINEISRIHGRTEGAIRSRLKHKNLYIKDSDVKNITIRDEKHKSGMFRVRFESENWDEIYYYNIKEKQDNIDETRPIFPELFSTEIGEINQKYNFEMLDKVQFLPDLEPRNVTINELDDLKINYLSTYIPKWCNRNDENSNRILDLKNKYIYAVKYYEQKVYSWLKDKELLNSDTIIAVIPSHMANENNYSGTSMIAKMLLNDSNMINGIDLIIRKITIPKKATSIFRPSLNTDINSISINNKIDLNRKKIVILDDVTTYGTSFKAAAYKLYSLGVKEIIPLAIGKTVIPDE